MAESPGCGHGVIAEGETLAKAKLARTGTLLPPATFIDRRTELLEAEHEQLRND
jgi:hypothetical protein